MKIELPTKVTKATRVNPKTMIIFSQPKMGKTTIAAGLDNALLIDLEDGSQFVDAIKFDVIKKAKEENKLPIIVLKQLIKAISEQNADMNGYMYKYILLDTVTALEEIVLPLANKLYRDTPVGKNWVGDDVTTLAGGAGYRYTRLALSMTLNELSEICETLIMFGHVKDKLVELAGEEINERSLSLTGKMPAILCSKVDAIGYLFREENQTIINFHPSDKLLVGSRSEHLKGKSIVVAESDDTGKVSVDWSKIFV